MYSACMVSSKSTFYFCTLILFCSAVSYNVIIQRILEVKIFLLSTFMIWTPYKEISFTNHDPNKKTAPFLYIKGFQKVKFAKVKYFLYRK